MSTPRESELEDKVASLENEMQRLRGAKPPVSGRGVMLFFGLTILAGVLAALGLFAIAKNTAAERKAKAVKPPATRVERAGAAIGTEVFRCAEAKPVKIFVRMKMTPEGTLAVLHATSEPEEPVAIPCVRKIPIDLRVEKGEGTGDVEVRYEGGIDAEGKRFSKVTWAAGE